MKESDIGTITHWKVISQTWKYLSLPTEVQIGHTTADASLMN